MTTKTKRIAGLLAAVATIIAVILWFRTPDWKRCYAQITSKMTVHQVREIMGRDEDESDNGTTAAGEFEKSWTFDGSDTRITVVFDQNGHSIYKELAPSFCGVTPLMGKLIPKNPDGKFPDPD